MSKLAWWRRCHFSPVVPLSPVVLSVLQICRVWHRRIWFRCRSNCFGVQVTLQWLPLSECHGTARVVSFADDEEQSADIRDARMISEMCCTETDPPPVGSDNDEGTDVKTTRKDDVTMKTRTHTMTMNMVQTQPRVKLSIRGLRLWRHVTDCQATSTFWGCTGFFVPCPSPAAQQSVH